MFKRLIIITLVLSFAVSALYAEEQADQEYINKLAYRRDKLSLVVKTREVQEKRSYSSTDISSYTYSYEAHSQTYGNIATSALQRSEAKEISDWYIYKGGIRELSDIEFLDLTGDRAGAARIRDEDSRRSGIRMIGNVAIGAGALTMIAGAGLSAGQSVITGGALLMVTGFFVSAFNLSPHHYIQPDYAQEKIDEYNVALKKKLNLPLTYE